jgi:hypothetical protein
LAFTFVLQLQGILSIVHRWTFLFLQVDIDSVSNGKYGTVTYLQEIFPRDSSSNFLCGNRVPLPHACLSASSRNFGLPCMSGETRPVLNNEMTSMARQPVMGAPVAKLTHGPRKPAESTSTLASRFSSEAPRGSSHDRESFRQLLQGLLGTSGTQTSEGIVIEDDVNSNRDLILVIVEAGLGLAHDEDQDPFENVNRRIFDSLTALDLVVRKTPNVLFLERFIDSGTDKEHVAPTFVWLIPKLFPLFGKPEDREIEGQVCKLLAFTVEAQNKCSQSRQICASVSDFLQFCADGMLPCPLQR